MVNRLNQFFVVCLLILGVGLLLVVLANNRGVSRLQVQIRDYELQIVREEENIRNLQAEIEYLSHPQRIEKLSQQNLPHLQSPNVKNIYIPFLAQDGLLKWQHQGKIIEADSIFLQKKLPSNRIQANETNRR